MTSLLYLGVATGVAALTITKAVLFRPLRTWIQQRSEWWGELASCPYCLSHWIGLGLVALYPPQLGLGRGDLCVAWLVIVAIAAVTAGVLLNLFLWAARLERAMSDESGED